MFVLLNKGLQKFKIGRWHKSRHKDLEVVLHDKVSACNFLCGLKQDYFSMMKLREVLAIGYSNESVAKMKDVEVIDRVAIKLALGEINIESIPQSFSASNVGLSKSLMSGKETINEVEEPLSTHQTSDLSLNEKNKINSLTVLIPLDEIFLEAVEDDEAILESTAGKYKKSLMVYDDGEKDNEEYVRLTFRDIIPEQKYTLTYDTKEDDEGTEVAKVIMFHSKLIGTAELEKPLKLEFPFEESKDF